MPEQHALNYQNLLKQGANTLDPHVDNAHAEALILLQQATKKSKEYLIAHSEENADDISQQHFEEIIQRRIKGEPIAYITQQKEFWSLPLQVNQNVLIPRPETELLVEVALAFLDKHHQANILDLGTGSGCIALALASEFPQTSIIATDYSQECIDTARLNATKLNIPNISFACSNWFDQIQPFAFDLIVSNPPYIARDDNHLEEQVRFFEPDSALFSENNGIQALKHIIEHAPDRLRSHGQLILEHGWQQAKDVRELLTLHCYQHIKSHVDFQGHTRVTSAVVLK